MNYLKKKVDKKYFPEIDSLRAIAIIAVIIYHFNKDFLPSGYLGVDIFFVISGFVMTNSLKNRNENNFITFFKRFISRRVKRLIPALIFYAISISIFICLINPIPINHINTGISSLFGSSNIVLFIKAKDYFALEQSLNPFLHTWSLGLEQQFYFIFPIFIWFSGFYNDKKNNSNSTIFYLSIISFFCFIYLSYNNKIGAYYLLPARFWEFGAGALLSTIKIKNKTFLDKLRNIPSFLPFFLLVISFFISEKFFIFPKIFAVLCTCILIKSFKKESSFYRFFINSKLRYIGLISYSLYLWHWGILSSTKYIFVEQTIRVLFLQIILIFSFSLFSYEIIEKKVTHYIEKLNENNLLKITFLFLLSSASIIYISGKFLVEKIYLGKFRPSEFEQVQKFLPCELNSYNPIRDPSNCLKKNKSHNKVIWLFGDSHASNLITSLQEAAYSNGYDAVLFLTNSNLLTEDKNKFIKIILEQLNNNDLIIFTNSYPSKSNDQKWDKIESSILRLVKLSNQSDAKLILVDGLPKFSDQIEFYSKFLFSRNTPFVSRGKAKNKRRKLTEILLKYVDKKNIFYIDPLKEVCFLDDCPAVINNKLIYGDTSPHFTIKGSSVLNNLFKKKIAEFMND